MGRLARRGTIEIGTAMRLALCAATFGGGCVGDPPAFTEMDASAPDARDDDDGPAGSDGGYDATPADGGGGDDAGGVRCDPNAPFRVIEPIAELNAASDEEGGRLTPDELVMYFTRRAGAGQPFQIYIAKRATRESLFGGVMPLLLLANASGGMIAPDQTTLYYSSDRGASDPNAHLYMSKVPFSASTSVALTALNSTALDYSPYVSADDTALYFVSRRPADIDDNIFVARREGDAFVEPTAVAGVNSERAERSPVLSADGLRLYIGTNRGSVDDFDIYVAMRSAVTEPFQSPVLVTELDTPSFEVPDWIAPDDCTLYFRSDRPGGPGGRDLWRARR
jgi:WD40-like Beta Propeller Repeat